MMHNFCTVFLVIEILLTSPQLEFVYMLFGILIGLTYALFRIPIRSIWRRLLFYSFIDPRLQKAPLFITMLALAISLSYIGVWFVSELVSFNIFHWWFLTDCVVLSNRPIQAPERLTSKRLTEWWTCRDLNSGPLPCQGSDLPTDLHAHLGAYATLATVMPMISIPKPTPMRKMHKAPTWRERHQGLLADTPEPDQEPYIPEGSVEEVIQTLSGVLDAVFRHGLPTVSHWNGLK